MPIMLRAVFGEWLKTLLYSTLVLIIARFNDLFSNIVKFTSGYVVSDKVLYASVVTVSF